MPDGYGSKSICLDPGRQNDAYATAKKQKGRPARPPLFFHLM